MSFSEQLTAAIAAVRTYAQIDNLSRELWAAYAAGLIDDDAAQAATELLHARRRSLRDDPRPQTRKAFNAPPKRRPAPRSPDREKSIVRRRACATSGAVPSRIACGFTLGEMATLSIVASEVKKSGDCRLAIDAIAAMAGVCRTVAQGALRLARALGFITVEERRRPGLKNLTNIVRIVSQEWRAWLRLGDRVRKSERHGNQESNNRPAARGSTRTGLSDRRSGEVTSLKTASRVVAGRDGGSRNVSP